MRNKITLNANDIFRASLVCVLLAFVFCAGDVAHAQATNTTGPAHADYHIGTIDAADIKEGSGIVASRRHPGVFWTHNDSGNPPQLFAIARTGKWIATFDVSADNIDWEDIAVDDDGYVYLADIGNNNGWRSDLKVYQFNEPDPAGDSAATNQKGKTVQDADKKLSARRSWKLSFPAGTKPFDCESFFVWKSEGYVISKCFNGQPAALYRFPLDAADDHVLEPVVKLPIRSPCTGADLSADGRRLAVVTGFGPSLFELPAPGDFSELANSKAVHVRWFDSSMEGICFAPAAEGLPAGILTTAEDRNVALFPFEAFGLPDGEAPADPTRVTIVTTSAAPLIDGAFEDWDENVGEIPLRVRANDALPGTARLWARWTDTGIFLAGRVPTKTVKPLSKNWFTGDCVEIFMGRAAPGRTPEYDTGDDRCYLGFSSVKTENGKPDETCPMVLRWPRHEEDADAAPNVTKGNVAGRVNADGSWQFEAFIPWQVDQRHLQPGDTLRLNVSILARDPRANWFISRSNHDDTWMSPLTWATAELK